jgi:hypothetical protein
VAALIAAAALPMSTAYAATPPPTEYNDGVAASASGPPAGTPCTTVNFNGAPAARACFQPFGDVLWIKDLLADGASAAILWKDTPDGATSFWRSGVGFNSLGTGTWARVNKDLPEASLLTFQAGVINRSTGQWKATGPTISARVDG